MDKPRQTTNNKLDNKSNNWLMYSGMAFEMLAIIGVFVAIGYFLDKKLGTHSLLLIVLLLTGIAVSFYRIYKQISN